MAMRSIRGATTAENNRECVLGSTKALLEAVMAENDVKIEDVISVIFTCTRDIDCVYPAVAAREIGLVNAALMCFDELYVAGSLPKCIRVMVNVESSLKQSEIRHVYQKEAVTLRPDITNQQ